MAFKDPRRSGELVHTFIDPGGFDHATVLRQIAIEDGQAALLAVSVFDGTDAALSPIAVQRGPTGGLAERGLGRDAGWTGLIEFGDRGIIVLHDIPCF